MKKGNDNFAKNIKILRNSRGLDQADIAHKIGVNSRTYQKYEYGQITPGEAKKIKIAAFYGVNVADLYRDDVFATESATPAPAEAESLILKKLAEINEKVSTPAPAPVDPRTELALAILAKLERYGSDEKPGDLVSEILDLDFRTADNVRLALSLKPRLSAEKISLDRPETQAKARVSSGSKK